MFYRDFLLNIHHFVSENLFNVDGDLNGNFPICLSFQIFFVSVSVEDCRHCFFVFIVPNSQ